MSWKKVGKQIASIGLPLLGGVVGGPGGASLGGMLARGLGLNTNSPTDILKAIQGDPEAFMKLKQVEADNEARLLELSLKDVADARSRQIEITKITGKSEKMIYVLATVICGGFFGLCALMMFKALPPGSTEAVFLLFGALASGFVQVITYFFGSSASSGKKTEMMAGQQAAMQRAVAAAVPQVPHYREAYDPTADEQ